MTTPYEILRGDKSKLWSTLDDCLPHGRDESIPLESLLACLSYFQTCRQIEVIVNVRKQCGKLTCIQRIKTNTALPPPR